MANIKGTFIVCIVLYCLNLPIQAYTVTKEYSGKYSNAAGIITVVAESKSRLFSIGFENDTLVMMAIDGGRDSNVCSFPTLKIDNWSANKIARTLGNGKVVVSAQIGKVEHLRGPVCSYVIVDPFKCSSIVEFKSFCGEIVPYQDSFDVVFWNWRQRDRNLKPHRYSDKGRLIKLENPIVQQLGSDYFDIATIQPFDPLGGYFYWHRRTASWEATIEHLDSEMKMQQWKRTVYNSRESTSMDYGRVTHCHKIHDNSDDRQVCDFMDTYLQVRMNVILPDLSDSQIHTVTNLPYGDVVVVREVEGSNINEFYVNIIKANGSVLESERLMRHSLYVYEGKGFVLSDSGEFCLVNNGKGHKDPSKEDKKLQELKIVTACIDVLEYMDRHFTGFFSL